MKKLSGLYRSEYEVALKNASATAFLGNVLLMWTSEDQLSPSMLTGAAETVCRGFSRMDIFLTESTDKFSVDDIYARNG